MLAALNCPDLRPNTSWSAEEEFPVCEECGARVPLKERIFYKSLASPIGYGLSCSRERQLPGNSSVSVEVIPRWVIWSYAARNKGKDEKKRKKNLIAPTIKSYNLQQGLDTSPVTLDSNVLKSHRQMMWHRAGLTSETDFLFTVLRLLLTQSTLMSVSITVC